MIQSEGKRSPRKRRPQGEPHDQRARIVQHLGTRAAVPFLRDVIQAPALDDRLKIYEDVDADAKSAQRWFKRWAGLALALMTVATLISSLMLFPIERLWPESIRWRGFVSGLQSAANAIALFVVWWLNRGDGVVRWIDLRAEAEELRGEYFRAALAAPVAQGVDAAKLLSEKLLLIESAHHDYQRDYLVSAIKKHAEGVTRRARPRRLSTAATVIAILIGILAAVAAIRSQDSLLQAALALIDDPIRWQLGLNTMASALLAFASARSMIHQDDRNAALYRGTLGDLDRVRRQHGGSAKAAAERGDEGAVAAYTADVQAILDADRRAWRLARQAMDPNASPPPKWNVW